MRCGTQVEISVSSSKAADDVNIGQLFSSCDELKIIVTKVLSS